MATDRSNDKVAEINANPNVEIAWFIPGQGLQFRIRGVAAPIGEEYEFATAKDVLSLTGDEADYTFWQGERERVFQGLGSRTVVYDHPTPSGALVPDGTDNSHFNFVLLAVQPEWVEVLDLKANMHSTTYRRVGETWAEEPKAVKWEVTKDREEL